MNILNHVTVRERKQLNDNSPEDTREDTREDLCLQAPPTLALETTTSELVATSESAATSELEPTQFAAAAPHLPQPVPHRRRASFVVAVTLATLLILAGSAVALVVYSQDNGRFAYGVSINDLDVSNLTVADARAKVDEKIKQSLDQSVEFVIDSKTITVKLRDLGLALTANETFEEAYQAGRQGTLLQKAFYKLNPPAQEFSLTKSWDGRKLEDTLTKTLSPLNRPAKDASFVVNADNSVTVTPEQTGLTVEMATLISKVKELDVFHPGIVIVPVQTATPNLTAVKLANVKFTEVIASYTTQFNAAVTGRSANIRLAAGLLDGTVLRPEKILSFNETVGPRTGNAGYQEANVIVNGKLVPGIGGGVCQVSTTLYNAVLLANLAIIERSSHELTVSYVPLGQDATVSYPSTDLKFKNNSGQYLLIRSKAGHDSVTFYIYGPTKPNQEVIISTQILSVLPANEQLIIDAKMPSGQVLVKQQGQPGYIVSTFRTVKQNGQAVKVESLGQSHYQPFPRIIITGPPSSGS